MNLQRFISTVLVLTSIALGAIACKKINLSTPTDALKTVLAATKDKDIETYKKTLSTHELGMLEQEAKRANKSVDDLLKAAFSNPNQNYPPEPIQTRDEHIDGNKAEVLFYNGKRWVRFFCEKEGDEWKLGGFADPPASFKP